MTNQVFLNPTLLILIEIFQNLDDFEQAENQALALTSDPAAVDNFDIVYEFQDVFP